MVPRPASVVHGRPIWGPVKVQSMAGHSERITPVHGDPRAMRLSPASEARVSTAELLDAEGQTLTEVRQLRFSWDKCT